MLKVIFALSAVLSLPYLAADAAEAIRPGGEKLVWTDSGVLESDGTYPSFLVHCDRSWNRKEQKKLPKPAGHTRNDDGTDVYRFQLAGFDVAQTVRRIGDGHYRVSYRLESDREIGTNSLYILTQAFPGLAAKNEIRLDGKRIPFPEKYTADFTRDYPDVRELALPLDTGFLEWKFDQPTDIRLEDLRQWNIPAFDIRIRLSPAAGNLRRSGIDAEVRLIPYRAQALNIAPPSGSGATAFPGLSNRSAAFRHVPFHCGQVIRLNHANPVLTLPVPPGSRTLYLLHSADESAEGEVARIRVTGRRSGEKKLPVTIGKSVGARQTDSAPADAFAQKEFSGSGEDGVFYAAAFELPDDAVGSIAIESAGNADYFIAAAAVSGQRIPLRAGAGDYTVQAGGDWRRFTPRLDVEPGSALDFSRIAGIDAPAGKYGRTVVKGPCFEFANRPGIPVRFYGVNLCFSANFLTKEQADILAARLTKQGFNAVRLHHFDLRLVKPEDSRRIDPGKLDQLDYLVGALKKAGVYITLDLFTIRHPAPGELKSLSEGLGSGYVDNYNFKVAMLFYPEVRENFRRFIKDLMCHTNPYTGMTWAEDPVFNTTSVLNENNILHLYDRCLPKIKAEAEKQFGDYRRANGIEITDRNRHARFREFLVARYKEYWREMTAYLREIGVKTPLTEQNFCSYPYLVDQRRLYDYVDNHKYWDHPTFGDKPWGLPMYFLGESALNYRLRLPKWLGNSRVFGKPYTVSEMNFCYPNPFRAEGALYYTAYGALQDWNGLYHFDYADSSGRMFPAGDNRLRLFDICNDMTRLIPARIGAALFLRRDVSAAKSAYPVAVDIATPSASETRFPEAAEDLFFIGKTGSLQVKDGKLLDPLPENTREICNLDGALKTAPAPLFDPEKRALANRFQSETGELSVDFERKVFKLVTPRTEAGVFRAGGGFTGNAFSAKSKKAFGVVAAITLNGSSFADSSRILLLHVTDCKQEGSRYNSDKQSILKDYGNPEHVVAERGICDFELKVSPGPWRLYALDFDGKRLGEHPFAWKDGRLRFTADTFRRPDRIVFAYELVRPDSRPN